MKVNLWQNVRLERVVLLFLLFYSLSFSGETREFVNRALKLDGNDNDIRIGMDTLQGNWTIEMWIKRDAGWSYPQQVLIGAGQYGVLSGYDKYPLMISSDKLRCNGAGITSSESVGTNWRHVAVSCDGSTTTLYMDGQVVGTAAKKINIVPGNIGSNTEQSKTFKGCIDEVRIWHKALPLAELQSWMNRPVNSEHPSFAKLKGYYTFDNGMEEMSPNLVGVAPYPYHAILTKVAAKADSKQALATYVTNDNSAFNSEEQHKLIAVTANSSEWDFDQGSTEDAHSLVVAVTGASMPVSLDEVTLNMENVKDLNDIESVNLYHLGGAPESDNPVEIASATPASELTFSSIGREMFEGANYFKLTYDISDDATIGNRIDAKISSVKISGESIKPMQNDTLAVVPHITENSDLDVHTLKVMSWNVWHGGNHLGDLTHGHESVVDIIKRSKADIVLMQEAYGTQQFIADELGFHLHTFGANDNLALFSRYPITKFGSNFATFNSIGVQVELPNKQKVALFDVWLKYAYRPEYTTWYNNDGYDPQVWIDEDKELNLLDMTSIIANDVSQVADDIPVIIGGDFNSCSHLDWTEKAKVIHNGYGPVMFPTSQKMYDEGFIDTYRTVHKDELTFPGGTWAASFGQVDSRIDFIYSRGDKLQPVASKIIRTSSIGNYPWPGDHSAVLTTFKTGGGVPIQESKFVAKSTVNVTSVKHSEMTLRVPATGTYSIAINSVNGQRLYEKEMKLTAGNVTLPMQLSSGVKIISISGLNSTTVMKTVVP